MAASADYRSSRSRPELILAFLILVERQDQRVTAQGTGRASDLSDHPPRLASAPCISLRRMVNDEQLLGEVSDPDGASVVLPARIWEEKIVVDHPEVRDLLDRVLEAVGSPDHVEPDPRSDRRRYYRRGVGPSRWLMVVVSFEQEPGRIITALALRKDPKRWKP